MSEESSSSERRDNTVLQAVLDLTTQVSNIQTELAVNTTETKNIVSRLDRLNGSVSEHARSISILERAVDVHTQTLASRAKTDEANAEKRNSWQDWLYKGLLTIGLILFYTLLTHSGIVSDFLK